MNGDGRQSARKHWQDGNSRPVRCLYMRDGRHDDVCNSVLSYEFEAESAVLQSKTVQIESAKRGFSQHVRNATLQYAEE